MHWQADFLPLMDSTAPETATPTWGAADTRVQAAFQEAKKKKKRKRKKEKGGIVESRAPAAAHNAEPSPPDGRGSGGGCLPALDSRARCAGGHAPAVVRGDTALRAEVRDWLGGGGGLAAVAW
uniref:Uncharacterized protein n=1 Tax=Capra hircus TaxID=9925 RepID=A0A8C2RVU3_CAPHI